MTDKVHVNGIDAHPVFKYLRMHTPELLGKNNENVNLPWNFCRFIVDMTGKVHKYLAPHKPLADSMQIIEKLLGV